MFGSFDEDVVYLGSLGEMECEACGCSRHFNRVLVYSYYTIYLCTWPTRRVYKGECSYCGHCFDLYGNSKSNSHYDVPLEHRNGWVLILFFLVVFGIYELINSSLDDKQTQMWIEKPCEGDVYYIRISELTEIGMKTHADKKPLFSFMRLMKADMEYVVFELASYAYAKKKDVENAVKKARSYDYTHTDFPLNTQRVHQLYDQGIIYKIWRQQ